jgi:hypothetical protein
MEHGRSERHLKTYNDVTRVSQRVFLKKEEDVDVHAIAGQGRAQRARPLGVQFAPAQRARPQAHQLNLLSDRHRVYVENVVILLYHLRTDPDLFI